MVITCEKEKYCGLNTPWRAMSIMPLLIVAPKNTPMAATVTMVRNLAALEPMAEFIKLTASLLTPTHRSDAASTKSRITNTR